MNKKIIIILLVALCLTGCQSKNEVKEDKFKTIFIEKKKIAITKNPCIILIIM